MKKTLLIWLLMFCSAGTLFAREKNVITQRLQSELAYQKLQKIQLFTVDEAAKDEAVEKEIKAPVYLRLNVAALRDLMTADKPYVQFDLPVSGSEKVSIVLGSYNILAQGFKVYESKNDQKFEVNYTPGKYFRGYIDGKELSLAAFSFFNDEVAAVFSTLDGGNYNLVLNRNNPGADNENYLLYRENNIVQQSLAPECHVSDDYKVIKTSNQSTSRRYENCKVINVSLRADNRLYLKKNSNVTTVTNYLSAVFNGLATLYANEQIYTAISEVVVNSTSDGYTYSSSSVVLNRFGQQTQNNFNGNLAHLVSGYTNSQGYAPLGGVAWLDVLCQQYSPSGSQYYGPYAFSNVQSLTSIPSIPTYSWDVECMTHEMGHNIGSPHTHNCSWPGGPIDGCAPTYDASLAEGSCATGPIPSSTVKGTIMSYCHLLQNVGISFSNGFGPLPGALIRNSVQDASCLNQYIPDSTLRTVNVRIANRECNDGIWTNYYYDNNTMDQSDDELLLSIKTNGQNIGTIDNAGFEVKVVEVTGYGSGHGVRISAPYTTANPTWTVMNRYFKITPITQPTTAVTVRFPFTVADFNDVKGSMPFLTSAAGMKLLTISGTAVADPSANHNSAALANVQYYDNAAASSTTKWALINANGSYIAEFQAAKLYSGGMGADSARILGVEDAVTGHALAMYPNPVKDQLFIQLSDNAGAAGSVEVFDNLGRLVYRQEVNTTRNATVSVPVASLPAGVYAVRYLADKKVLSGLFIKK